MKSLKEIYNIPHKIIVTAHRGFSGKFPENTLVAFEEAVKIGADIVEFDVRSSSDGVPVIFHDETLDRATNGTGNIADYSLSKLKHLKVTINSENCPNTVCQIPTFEETLELLAGKVFLNIQVYADSLEIKQKICRLFDKFKLYNQAFLMIPLFSDIAQYRAINPQIDLCVGEDRTNLARHRGAGLTFIQPYFHDINPDFCKKIEEFVLCANMFFSNNDQDNNKYIAYGIKGIMTDFPDILINSSAKFTG
jgi:glycerophosphoryl diester phosphodiesterase